ncbi:hypothetical protein DL98DRAFT_599400 [Cadophora sp. DSE1049]|nr:hypothetical protein DL98DRAFT_599400 [Cadophora sp. DSE1049]
MPSGSILSSHFYEGRWKTTLNVTANDDSWGETATIATVDVIKIDWDSQWQSTVINPNATECSFVWCEKAHHNATVLNGRLDLSNTSETLLKAPYGQEKYKFDSRDFRNFNVASHSPVNNTYIVNANDIMVIARFFYELFQDVSDEDAVA